MSNKNRMISIGARAGGADRDGACRLNSKNVERGKYDPPRSEC